MERLVSSAVVLVAVCCIVAALYFSGFIVWAIKMNIWILNLVLNYV
ncbi:TMhelix containing protein [Vibrio phage 22O28-1]|nr:TMhelix containing protein [Vibrio phage 22O28-1]